MIRGTALSLAVIAIHILYLATFYSSLSTQVYAETSLHSEEESYMYVLKDLGTAIEKSVNVYATLYWGLPSEFIFADAYRYVVLKSRFYINNTPFEEMKITVHRVNYSGYALHTSMETAYGELDVSVYALYTVQSFYIELCSASYILTNFGMLLNSEDIVDVHRYDHVNGVELILNTVYVAIVLDRGYNFSMFDSALMMDTNIGAGCLSIYLVFSEHSINESLIERIDAERRSIMVESERYFNNILSLYPSIEARNMLLDNLYRYSLYNMINIVYGYPDRALCNRHPIDMYTLVYFLSFTMDEQRVLNQLKSCIQISNSSVENIALELYIDIKLSTLDPSYGNSFSRILDKLKLLENMFKEMVTSGNYSIVTLAFIRKILIDIEAQNSTMINAMLPLIRNIVRDVEDRIENIMYTYNHYVYQYRGGSFVDVDRDNIIESASILAIDIPRRSSHAEYIVSLLKTWRNITIPQGPWLWLAVAGLLRNSYPGTALALLLQNMDEALHYTPQFSLLYLYLYGLLGLNIGYSAAVFSPSIPVEAANIRSYVYLCGRRIEIEVVGWGVAVDRIYVDGSFAYSQIVPIASVCDAGNVVIFMKTSSIIRTTIRVLFNGAPMKGLVVSAVTDYGVVSSITDIYGDAYIELPTDSDVAIYIRLGEDMYMLKIHTPSEGYSWFIEVSLPQNSTELTLLNRIVDVEKSVSELNTELMYIENRLSSMERGSSNASSSTDLETLKAYIDISIASLKNVLYILIAFSLTAIVVAVVALFNSIKSAKSVRQ